MALQVIQTGKSVTKLRY